MLSILGIIFLIIILGFVLIVVWGLLFGNGTASLRNKNVTQQIRINIAEQISKQLGLDSLNEISDNAQVTFMAYFLAYVTVINEAIFNAISSTANPTSINAKEIIKAKYNKGDYEYGYLAEIVIGYTLATVKLYDKSISNKAILGFIKSLKLSDIAKKRIANNFDYAFSDFELMGGDNYIGFAEGGITDYLLADKPTQLKRHKVVGDPLLNISIRTYVITTMSGAKDQILPDIASFLKKK